MSVTFKGKERGQAAIEFAFCAPIVVMGLVLAVQCAFTVYCATALSAGIEHARYEMQAYDASTGDVAARKIRDALVEAQPVLGSGTLTVSDAEIFSTEDEKDTVVLPDADFDEYRIATKNVYTSRVRVSAKVVYEPPCIFGAIGQPRFEQQVLSSRIVDESFEVG